MKNNVKKISILVWGLLISLSTTYAQITDSSQPMSKDYSESVPYTPTVFPDLDAKKKRKSKTKSDKNSVASSEDKSVTIPVTVVDKQGTIITGLKKSDFNLFVDNQEITDFTVENKEPSLNIVLLLDTSPSTDKIKDFQDYALTLVENLQPQDQVLVAEFNELFENQD